jgi:hypothetical protein
VQVELLVVPDCPHETAARDVLREAARLAGIDDLQVTVTVIDTDEQARRRGFVGSPTLLVNGVDPFAVSGAPTGVTCRVYVGVDGPSGVPDVAAVRDALVRACACPASAVCDQ